MTAARSLPERAGRALWLAFCALVAAFLVAPILVIVPLSFNAGPHFSFTEAMVRLDPAGWSLRWYEALLTTGLAAPEGPRDLHWWGEVWRHADWVVAARHSLTIAALATAVATPLGTLAALGLARPGMPWRRTIMAFLLSPIIVPLIVTATGMFLFFSDPCAVLVPVGFDVHCGRLAGTLGGVVLGHATLGVPFVVVIVTATLAGFDRRLAQAAAGLGAGPATVFRRVTLPLILPGIVIGALFAFVTSLDEVVLVLFLAGPDQRTLPLQMWSGLREQISPAILAVAVLLAGLSLLFLAAVEVLRRR